jgi:hypothetical protein
MIIALNAHGICPWVVSQGNHPKTLNSKKIDMKTDYRIIVSVN